MNLFNQLLNTNFFSMQRKSPTNFNVGHAYSGKIYGGKLARDFEYPSDQIYLILS